MATVLIVEDQLETRELFMAMIQQLGHDVTLAAHGVDGLHQLKMQPDVVLLDLNMPVASGDVVLGFIRSTDELKQTKVIVVSAHPDAVKMAHDLGADGCLTKPVTFDEIEAELNRVLGG